jgi:hypothetical protein
LEVLLITLHLEQLAFFINPVIVLPQLGITPALVDDPHRFQNKSLFEFTTLDKAFRRAFYGDPGTYSEKGAPSFYKVPR